MATHFVTGGSGFVGRALIAALRARGDDVVALARSDKAAQVVEALGARAARGDLDDVDAMAAGMSGCRAVFHSAAHVSQEGTADEFYRGNVLGTEHTLLAARRAGVSRFIHVSTEAVLVGERPLIRATESWPYPQHPVGLYGATKALAEQRVRAANSDALQTIIVRPRFIWGKGDTTLLPVMVAMVKAGQFAWIGGGHYLTSTTHVQNVVEGLLLAEEKGKAGETYFVTDGEPHEFRGFISELLQTQGVDPPTRSVPAPLARMAARALAGAWSTFGVAGSPPLTPTVLKLTGEEVTIDDGKARRELGYVGRVSRAQGMAELRGT